MLMPIKRFWFYHRSADRLEAATDLRMLHLMTGVTSQEGVNKLQERLGETVGEIYVYQPVQRTYEFTDTDSNTPDPEFDRNGLEALRANIMRHGR